MYIIGSVVSGSPVATSPAQFESDLASQFGGSWTFEGIQSGYCPNGLDANGDPNAWAIGPYIALARNSSGTLKMLDFSYDASQNRIYRPGNGSIGSGATGTCMGCEHCITKFDENLNVIGCSCIGDGNGCSLGIETLV